MLQMTQQQYNRIQCKAIQNNTIQINYRSTTARSNMVQGDNNRIIIIIIIIKLIIIMIIPAYCFVPLAFETLGAINHEGMGFFNNLGHRLTQVTGDSKETTFLYQHLSVTIQRFNALAFHGTFGTDIIEY